MASARIGSQNDSLEETPLGVRFGRIHRCRAARFERLRQSGDADRLLSPVERPFVYLPFAHAEDLAAQRRSLSLFRVLDQENLRSAKRHYEIIARFGRFPHRNAILGRQSTAEEAEFLTQPGSSF